jgi:hypothetical protein
VRVASACESSSTDSVVHWQLSINSLSSTCRHERERERERERPGPPRAVMQYAGLYYSLGVGLTVAGVQPQVLENLK